MIEKYKYGCPIETDAVTVKLPVSYKSLPFFKEEADGSFTLPLGERDIVYGLGEQVRGINKRGWKYTSFNHDNCNHQEDTHSLYGTHNFMIISGEGIFGVFFDTPGRISFDVGFTHRNLLSVKADQQDMYVYIITGIDEKDITKQFRKIIGRSYIAPKWAFGCGQSRWGYRSADEIREIAHEYRKGEIPLDSIYLDIDYMERYKDFTVNTESFPDLKGLCSEMSEMGIHLVPIIDAGVKVEDDYFLYEEGKENNYFCKDCDGNDFIGAVWPGKSCFPDFLNSETREWFGSKYKILLDMGIDGFWNDMNEPAIFYSEKGLNNALEKINELSRENMGINEFFQFTGIVNSLSSSMTDYESFFHNIDGKQIQHKLVHNLYGAAMTKAADDAFRRLSPDKRILLISRSSAIGSHRSGGIWQGDNKSWWSHLLMNLQMMPSLNMAGFIFTGADTGGFNSDVSEDLLIRWLQLSAFTPLLRNHSAIGTRQQEPYRFDSCNICKKMLDIRCALIPYIYSEYMKAVLNDEMMFRPLGFDFPHDKAARETEDELFLGNELMIAPVYKQNALGRYVYLPEEMMLVRMKAPEEYETQILPQGHHYIDSELDELVFFIRKNKAIPLGKTAPCTEMLDYSVLSLIGYDNAEYVLYNDDGITASCDINNNTTTLRNNRLELT